MSEKETAHHFLSVDGLPSQTMAPEPTDLEAFTGVVRTLRAGLPPVDPRETIGEGGAGVVRVVRQRALGRDVAAKQLKEGRDTEAAEQRLLQEAWVVGGLEHPNVVPVHDMVIDAEGRLTLLMKRVEGETWSRWLDDPEGLRATFSTDDPLGWHLTVLRQVCQALAFAHARGVVHRDIKPDNVMIGAFGEVLIIDWGVAAGLEDSSLAPPAQPGQIAGTPLYMAPEMWEAPETVDARSDVYLVGAVLFEILTGSPPHRIHWLTPPTATMLREKLPDGTPAGLADLVSDCLAAEPTQRPPSVEAVRARLDAFQQHRGSEALTDQALITADTLPQVEPERREAVFEEARFGLTAALTQWSGNTRARQGLQDLLTTMAALRLDADDARGAARLLDDLPAVHAPELRARVQAVLAERARLEALGRQADPAIGVRPRAAMIVVLAAVWVAIPILGQILVRPGPPERSFIYGSAILLFVVTAAAVLLLRDSIRRSSISRRLVGWVLLTPILQGLQALGLDLAGVDPYSMQAAQFFLWGTMCSAAAVAVDRRLGFAGLAYLLAYLVAVQLPGWRYAVMLFPNTVLGVVVLWIYLGAARGAGVDEG